MQANERVEQLGLELWRVGLEVDAHGVEHILADGNQLAADSFAEYGYIHTPRPSTEITLWNGIRRAV